MERETKIYDARQGCLKRLETIKHDYQRQEKQEKGNWYRSQPQEQRTKQYRLLIRSAMAGLLFLFLLGVKTGRIKSENINGDQIDHWIKSNTVAIQLEQIIAGTIEK